MLRLTQIQGRAMLAALALLTTSAHAASAEPTTPAAKFSAEYQAANRGKIQVLTPEVHELVNIAIALTPTAQASPSLVVKTTPYYTEMMAHFSRVANHPFVAALEAEMKRDHFNYWRLKMNGYAFEYDAKDQIVRSPVYDRTNFGDTENELLPFLEEMRSFSKESGFRAFFNEHQALYAEQVRFYEKDADVDGMIQWLKGRFPNVSPYDGVKVIFSPLVGSNQSLATLEADGYRELQPHVNFPYPSARHAALTPKDAGLSRGVILFTEINHGFINPTAEPYRTQISEAVKDRSFWIKAGPTADSYAGSQALFLEMMNWGLISLYYADHADAPDTPGMIGRIDTIMVEQRGFIRFAEFNRFLVDLYRKRPEGTTIADLYPQIIAWCAEHQRQARAAAAD